MPVGQPVATQLFSSSFLRQLEALSFISKRTFLGRIKGDRKSLRKGQSVEFADYRPYEVGDDLRYVDWNIFGRHDRLYLKLFVDEEDLSCHVLLDGSGSMDFGEPTKFRYGVRLAAALAFVALSDHERAGVAIFRDRVTEGWPPSRRRSAFFSLIDFLTAQSPVGATGFNGALRQYAQQVRTPGLAVVISDLMDPVGFEEGLRALQERRFDIHLIHLLSDVEMDPPFVGDLRLVDAETGDVREVTLDGEALRSYRERLAAYLARVEDFCLSNSIGYHRCSTALPLEDLILRHLKGSLLG